MQNYMYRTVTQRIILYIEKYIYMYRNHGLKATTFMSLPLGKKTK